MTWGYPLNHSLSYFFTRFTICDGLICILALALPWQAARDLVFAERDQHLAEAVHEVAEIVIDLGKPPLEALFVGKFVHGPRF